MPILHATNTRNVKASIIRYFRDELELISRPAILPSYSTPIDRPETGIATPAITFDNIPAGTRYPWMGNRVSDSEKGGRSFAILDASCWASRGNINWAAQLDVMQSMIENVALKANNGISVRDYTTDASNPVTQPYLIRIIEVETVQTVRDSNPDIERRRILVSYSWIHRAS